MDLVELARDDVLPLLVVGYELPTPGGSVSGDPLRDFPVLRELQVSSAIYVFGHQLGGYACLSVNLVGVGLLLAANLEHAGGEAGRLLEILRAMGETRSNPVFASDEFAVLQRWYRTHGEAPPDRDLRELEQLLQRCVPALPPLVTGLEALVETAPVVDASCFAGWTIARFAPAAGSTDRSQLSFWNLAEYPVITEGPACDPSVFEQLRVVGDALGIATPPRVFLLWENSD